MFSLCFVLIYFIYGSFRSQSSDVPAKHSLVLCVFIILMNILNRRAWNSTFVFYIESVNDSISFSLYLALYHFSQTVDFKAWICLHIYSGKVRCIQRLKLCIKIKTHHCTTIGKRGWGAASMKLSIFKTESRKLRRVLYCNFFHGFQMAALKPSAHSQWPVLAQIINHQTTAATPSVQTVAKLLLQDSEALRNDAHSTNMMNDFGFVRCRESAYNYNKLRASIAKVIISGHS